MVCCWSKQRQEFKISLFTIICNIAHEFEHCCKLMENNLFNDIFRDQEGKVVLAQMPNLPLITWIVASLLKIIFTTGKINIGLEVLAFGALFTWAWEELFQGVNYFRRTLGSGQWEVLEQGK